MHEWSIVRALLDRVEDVAREHRATAVHRVYVRVGRLSGVEVDLVRSAYDLFRDRTICSGAELEIVPVDPTWSCPGCGERIEPDRPPRCDSCQRPARLESGDEILLERLEMEVA